VVSGALDAGLCRLVGEAGLAVRAGEAGQAQTFLERLEAGAADAVLDDGPACLVESARVWRAGPAVQVGSRVLEGVDGALGAEARKVAASELARGAGAALVCCVSLVAEAADAVAAVGAPRERGVEPVEHQQLVRGPAVGGEGARLTLDVALHKVMACGAEHARVVGEEGLLHERRTRAAAET